VFSKLEFVASLFKFFPPCFHNSSIFLFAKYCLLKIDHGFSAILQFSRAAKTPKNR